jgi:hypothetical protein
VPSIRELLRVNISAARARISLQPRVFLLSPARLHGKHTHLLFPPGTNVPGGASLHSKAGAPIGEIFTFLSGLFRGKPAYAEAFFARLLAPRPPSNRKRRDHPRMANSRRGVLDTSSAAGGHSHVVRCGARLLSVLPSGDQADARAGYRRVRSARARCLSPARSNFPASSCCWKMKTCSSANSSAFRFFVSMASPIT